MKIVSLVARILLGLAFLVFGLNKFHEFMPSGAPHPGAAGQFMGALMSTHYIVLVGFFECAGGLLLLFNRYVPLGLVFLGPIIVNILAIGVLMVPMALPPGLIVALLWMLVYWRHRTAFAGIFQAKQPG